MDTEKQALLVADGQNKLVERKQQRMCVKSLFLIAFVALLITVIQFPSTFDQITKQVLNYSSWNKYSAVGHSVINEKYHFIWKEVFDQASNSARGDIYYLKRSGHIQEDESRIQEVTDYLSGSNNRVLDLNKLKVYGPVTVLFNNGDIYGLYPKDGKPACRHYHHEYTLPEVNPLENATNHGVEFAHHLVYADRYTDLNFPEPAPGHPVPKKR